MKLSDKITKETRYYDLELLLGEDIYNNLINLYNRLKNENINRMFYSDYLTGEFINKWFVFHILDNEDLIDFAKPINEIDYEELVTKINDNYPY